MRVKYRILLALTIALLFGGLSSCEDELGYNIPHVYVNIRLNLSDPEHLPFKSGNAIPLDSIYPNNPAGYAGIIIIKGIDASNGLEKYYAFDQCCPVEPFHRHKLVPDGATVKCEEDDVTFVVFDGSGLPIEGKSSHPLKPYKTSIRGTTLHIYN